MKRILTVFALACVPLLSHSSGAAAQCYESCAALVAPDGTKGWGCIPNEDAATKCTARATRCSFSACYEAMLTDPSGRVLAVADICSGNVTMRPLSFTSKPRSAAKLRPQRGTTLTAARKATAPSAE